MLHIKGASAVSEDGINMLLPRIITIIIGLPLLLLCIHWGGIPYVAIITGIILLGLREFYRMAINGGYDAQPVIGQLAGLIMLGCMLWSGTQIGVHQDNIVVSLCVIFFLMIVFFRELFSSSFRTSLLRISLTFAGVFYIVWTLGHLCLIRELKPLGREYTYLLFFVIWAVDLMAYVVGKKLGRFKLAPWASPGKTIEGTIGGICAGVAAGLFMQPLMFHNIPIARIASLSFFIGVFAQFSDLSESVVKRSFGVKNASALLPGHGGILDRFDSFIFTAPLLYYYLLMQG